MHMVVAVDVVVPVRVPQVLLLTQVTVEARLQVREALLPRTFCLSDSLPFRLDARLTLVPDERTADLTGDGWMGAVR